MFVMRMGVAVLLLFLSFGLARSAAAETGKEILKKVDRAVASPGGLRETAQLEIQDPGTEKRLIKFKVVMKGDHLIRMDFLSPGNVKGMRFLSRSPRQMYAYVPAQRKTRRLGSHVMAMGFMGSTFSHEEMSLLTYSTLYTAKLVSEDDKTWTLHATAKPGSEAPYPRLEMVVRRDNAIPQEIRYFNRKGVNIKIERREDFECRKSKCLAKRLIMKDQINQGKISTIQVLEWQDQIEVSDSFFTVQALRRAR